MRYTMLCTAATDHGTSHVGLKAGCTTVWEGGDVTRQDTGARNTKTDTQNPSALFFWSDGKAS
jgi:hypothetical protein